MKVYLAGPMRGIPEYNFPAFREGARVLRAQGLEVFSPVEWNDQRYGVDISEGNSNGDDAVAEKEHGFNLREALGADLAWICAHADAVVTLPGWENSKGATAERATALALGLPVWDLKL